jgi:hypothetical protein
MTLGSAQLVLPQTLISYEHAATNPTEADPLENLRLSSENPAATLHLVKRKVYGTMCLDYYCCE